LRERADIGWRWDWSSEDPWRPLQAEDDVKQAYVVCLTPEVAAYDPQVGLRLGEAGTAESPWREPPKRPGYPYGPLRKEDWATHARGVARESERRLREEGINGGQLEHGLRGRYGLSAEDMVRAAEAAGLLHDVGKLQVGWQAWAEAAQKSRNPTYTHDGALAHTDFNWDDPEDRRREHEITQRRPPHAASSGYFGSAMAARLFQATPDATRRTQIASACLAAVVAHHGGWWPQRFETPGLWSGWQHALELAFGWSPEAAAFRMLTHENVGLLLDVTTSPDNLIEHWPLVAFLTRTLRLSDQRATAEGAHE